MLIGTIFDKAEDLTATDMCAFHLADEVRNLWLQNTAQGREQWEESFCEHPDVIPQLQEEGFPNLQGIDYLFRWWGDKDSELAGEVTVVWKICEPSGDMAYYRTWVRLAERDFSVGLHGTETRKREVVRSEFRQAFAQWKENYPL
jgi:hypothetical protein